MYACKRHKRRECQSNKGGTIRAKTRCWEGMLEPGSSQPEQVVDAVFCCATSKAKHIIGFIYTIGHRHVWAFRLSGYELDESLVRL